MEAREGIQTGWDDCFLFGLRVTSLGRRLGTHTPRGVIWQIEKSCLIGWLQIIGNRLLNMIGCWSARVEYSYYEESTKKARSKVIVVWNRHNSAGVWASEREENSSRVLLAHLNKGTASLNLIGQIECCWSPLKTRLWSQKIKENPCFWLQASKVITAIPQKCNLKIFKHLNASMAWDISFENKVFFLWFMLTNKWVSFLLIEWPQPVNVREKVCLERPQGYFEEARLFHLSGEGEQQLDLFDLNVPNWN